jgi:hypothetical protein
MKHMTSCSDFNGLIAGDVKPEDGCICAVKYFGEDMSKGSRPRPVQDKQKFDENWDKIFGSKKNKQQPTKGKTN